MYAVNTSEASGRRDLLAFSIQSNTLRFKMTDEDDQVNTFIDTSEFRTTQKWSRVGVSAAWNGSIASTFIIFYGDGNALSSTITTLAVLDSSSHSHLIGAEYNLNLSN